MVDLGKRLPSRNSLDRRVPAYASSTLFKLEEINMVYAIHYLWKILVFLVWITGLVLAEGFWSTFFALWFLPWGWYLVVERIILGS